MCGRQSGDAAGSGSPDSATLHVQHGHPRRRTAHLALALRVLDCALLRRVLSVATNWLGRQSPLMCVSISWRFHARSPFLAAPDEMEQPLLILFYLSVRFSCDSKTSLRTAEKKVPKLHTQSSKKRKKDKRKRKKNIRRRKKEEKERNYVKAS